jgi:hypothetical protein
MTAACRFSNWAETYVDGELSPEHTIDFEEHLSACCSCQTKVRFEQALRFSMRRATRVVASPSAGFEARLRALMVAERSAQCELNESDQRFGATHQKCETVPRPVPPVPRPLTWRTIAPLSVAAAAAIVFAAMRNEPNNEAAISGRVSASVAGNGVASHDTMQTVRDFLDQLATDSEHSAEDPAALVEEAEPVMVSPRPPSMINVSSGRHWTLPRLENIGGIWEGLHYRELAREGRIPSLHYRIGGHRVLLWAYDSERVPLRVLLEPRVARNHPVFVGTRHGLAIAAVERQGQGFVATTDLSPSEAAELIVTAAVH